jgi:hypothetical protein
MCTGAHEADRRTKCLHIPTPTSSPAPPPHPVVAASPRPLCGPPFGSRAVGTLAPAHRCPAAMAHSDCLGVGSNWRQLPSIQQPGGLQGTLHPPRPGTYPPHAAHPTVDTDRVAIVSRCHRHPPRPPVPPPTPRPRPSYQAPPRYGHAVTCRTSLPNHCLRPCVSDGRFQCISGARVIREWCRDMSVLM